MAASVPFPRLVSVVVLLATLVLTSLAPLPAAAADTGLCKGGGWANFRDAAGTPFTNQGQCVRHAATGGELAVGSIDLTLERVERQFVEDTIQYSITGERLAPGTAVTVTATLLDGSTETSTVGTVADDGTVLIQHGQPDVGHFECDVFRTFKASAVDAVGTTVTDAEDAPC